MSLFDELEAARAAVEAMTVPREIVFADLQPKYTWQWCLNGDWHALTVSVEKAPCAFYRFMQRWCLGIHWRPHQ